MKEVVVVRHILPILPDSTMTSSLPIRMAGIAILNVNAVVEMHPSNATNAMVEEASDVKIVTEMVLSNVVLVVERMRWIVQTATDLERMKKETNAQVAMDLELILARNAVAKT